ncbi:MAG: tetratricopeptide repeat protein [Bacteroidetes bacterium]|nr:tetratricopeptide repeat protein [Bacteroidota bacterium]
MKTNLVAITLFLFACSPTVDDKETEPTDSQSQLPEVEQVSKRIEQEPNNHNLLYMRANIYLKKGELKPAEADLKRAMALDPANPIYPNALAELYFATGGIYQAINVLKEYEPANPRDEVTLMNLGRYHFLLKEYNPAKQYLDRLLIFNSAHSQAYFFKGLIYKETADTVKAINNLQAAVEQDPDFLLAYLELGQFLSELKDPLAVDYLNNAIRIDSSNMEARYSKAMYYQGMDDFKSAKQVYRKMIMIDPQYERTWYNLGYLYFQNDSIEKALTNFDRATKVNPSYAKAYYMRGLCFETTGNIEKAIIDYRQTLNLDPEMSLALEALDRIKP